jgi:hypothetical protein
LIRCFAVTAGKSVKRQKGQVRPKPLLFTILRFPEQNVLPANQKIWERPPAESLDSGKAFPDSNWPP